MTPAEAIGRRARIHWHLTKRVFSVKVAGHPVFYVPAIRLRDCQFFIDARLRALFESRPQCRTVHALVAGTIVDFDDTGLKSPVIVKCDPFAFATFVRDRERTPVSTASAVALRADRTIEALDLT